MEFLCWDTVPAGEHKNHDREQPRTGQVMVAKGIPLAQVGQSGLAGSYHLLANLRATMVCGSGRVVLQHYTTHILRMGLAISWTG